METVPESDELPSEPTAPGGDVTIPATAEAEKTSPITADVPAATVADAAAAVGEKESEDEDVDLTEDKEDEQQLVGVVAVIIA